MMTSQIGRYGLRRMSPRDPDEPHRASSPLEAFFDLVFVVAVSFSSANLYALENKGSLVTALGSYAMVFFAVWWAWMNFTWFATSFDVDDWPYRLLTILQMAGALVLAAGTTVAMDGGDFSIVTFGYVGMRLAMVAQWLRAMGSHPEYRDTARRYVIGIVTIQVLWLLRLLLPDSLGVVSFLVLVIGEVAVPIWAESRRPTPWNPGHITERYSLFTLIVLGESILASANILTESIDLGEHIAELMVIALCALIIAAGMWWIYFSREKVMHISTLRSTLFWGYSHYFIFAAAGAFSAGIEVAVDSTLGHGHVGRLAALTLSGPVATFIVGIWLLSLRSMLSPRQNMAMVVGVGIILSAALLTPPLSTVMVALGVVVCAASTEVDRCAVETSSSSHDLGARVSIPS